MLSPPPPIPMTHVPFRTLNFHTSVFLLRTRSVLNRPNSRHSSSYHTQQTVVISHVSVCTSYIYRSKYIKAEIMPFAEDGEEGSPGQEPPGKSSHRSGLPCALHTVIHPQFHPTFQMPTFFLAGWPLSLFHKSLT